MQNWGSFSEPLNRINLNNKEWKKYLATDQSFYNDYYIDKLAKAIISLMDSLLEEKQTIFSSDFIEKYIKILENTFNLKELLSPRVQLTETALYINNDKLSKNLDNYIMNIFKIDFLYTTTSFKETKYKNLNGLLVIYGDEIKKNTLSNLLPKSYIKLIKENYKKNREIICFYQKNPSSILYILVTKNYIQSLNLLKKLYLFSPTKECLNNCVNFVSNN